MATISGTVFDDTLEGTDETDVFYGLAGDDYCYDVHSGETFYGGDGRDIAFAQTGNKRGALLYGGEGNDDLWIEGGRVRAYGGEGNDAFAFLGGTAQAFGGAGCDTLYLTTTGPLNFTLAAGGSGTWVARAGDPGGGGTLTYTEIEGVEGSNSDDTLRGNGAGNFLWGGPGADHIIGMAGNDLLIGEDGHDTVSGGRGRDAFAFYGSESRHTLRLTSDVITDFDPAQDRLVFFSRNFQGLHTASNTADATVAETALFNILASEFAVQTTRFAATTGVRVIYDSDDGLLYYDADGALSGYLPRLIADIGEGHALTAGDIFLY